jgi:hypothetical protein
MTEMEWMLEPGDVIKRTELHELYGGSHQSGICPSTKTPNILLFSDPASGVKHGYRDRWEPPLFLYVGEGQRGDQTITKGNKVVLEHRETARALRVFEGSGDRVRYLGEYVLDDPPYVIDRAPETGGGPERSVVRFRLLPARVESEPQRSRAQKGYRRADEEPITSAGEPFERDPNQVDRSLAAHARTQNALADFLKKHGVRVWSPGEDDPDFDLAWERRETVWVGEVKSLGDSNEAQQLRLGLGQVLDYQDTLLVRHRNVRAALAVSRAPSERRWVDVCERHGVTLVWPGTFDEVLR